MTPEGFSASRKTAAIAGDLTLWQDSRMLTVLAQSPDTSFSWNILATPAGVVLGAVIAGFVAWRNARKSVYERLESLVKVRKDWPDNLDGGDTIDHAIAFALAEIRRKERGHASEPTTKSEREADEEVKSTARRESITTAVVSLLGLAAAAVAAFVAPKADSAGDWLTWAVTGFTLLAVTIGISLSTRR